MTFRFLVASMAALAAVSWAADPQLPEWETTAKLRYAPPTLVAPTVVKIPVTFSKVVLAPDEDAILELPVDKERRRKLMTDGGRNLRIIGGAFRACDLQPMRMTRSLFLEGLTFDYGAGLPLVNGLPVDLEGKQVHDAIHTVGAAPNSEVAPDVYVQNCHIAGTHGTFAANGEPVEVVSVTYARHAYTVVAAAPHGLAVGQTFICGPTSEPKLSRSYTVTEVVGETVVKAKTRKGDKTNVPTVEGTTGTGGYLWPELPKVGLHADGYQCNDNTVQNAIHFYKVTFVAGYQAFIGGHAYPDNQARALTMTRVNLRPCDVWPHNDRSMFLYLADYDQQGGPADRGRKREFPTEFDRVFLQPRTGYSILEMVGPPPKSTIHDKPVGIYTTDGGKTAQWAEGFGSKGHITRSEDGFSSEPGFEGRDYADLTGPHAPGLHYKSPGYSSDAIAPLVMTEITSTPAKLSANTDAGTVVTRLDVTFTGAGHIIDLKLTDDAGGRFALRGRDVVWTVAVEPAGTALQIAVQATQRGTPKNALTKTIQLPVGK